MYICVYIIYEYTLVYIIYIYICVKHIFLQRSFEVIIIFERPRHGWQSTPRHGWALHTLSKTNISNENVCIYDKFVHSWAARTFPELIFAFLLLPCA